jgi:hypothetical protein
MKHPGTRSSITARAEFSWLFLTRPANRTLPKLLIDLSRLEESILLSKNFRSVGNYASHGGDASSLLQEVIFNDK